MNLAVTLIQTALHWEDIEANLAMLEEKIWQIHQKSDLIILPEMFNTGFSMNALKLAEPMKSKTFKWMRQISAQTGAVITGSYIIKENYKYYNRLLWMQPDGEFDFYDKRHLFKLTGEHEIYTAGNKKIIKEIKGLKICPLICYDLRFPEWSRNKATLTGGQWITDYDMLIYVANWPNSRKDAWMNLLKARAIENSCYVVGVNIIGKDGRGYEYVGDSFACDPLVKMLGEANGNECIKTFSLNFDNLNMYRNKYPFLQDADIKIE